MVAGNAVIDGDAVKVLLLSPLLLDCCSGLVRLPFMAPAVWRGRTYLQPALRAQGE